MHVAVSSGPPRASVRRGFGVYRNKCFDTRPAIAFGIKEALIMSMQRDIALFSSAVDRIRIEIVFSMSYRR